jgi:hypothetical protein
MAYSIRKNWVACFEVIVKRPIVLLPFVVIAFLEALALELLYFYPRKPIALVAGPVIKKFFGEGFLHYPENIIILPNLFYYAQVVIYVIFGVFLMAICVNIFKNVKEGLPLKARALIKNAASKYLSFLIFGIIMIALAILVKKADTFLYAKFMRLLMKYLPKIASRVSTVGFVTSLFVSNIMMQTLLTLTVPIMVIRKKSLLKALLQSVFLGTRRFPTIFKLIFVPLLVYLPISLLKSMSLVLLNKMFPEINLCIIGAGIVISLFVDSFVIMSVSQWLIERGK